MHNDPRSHGLWERTAPPALPRKYSPGTMFGRVLADHISGKLSEAALPLPISDARQPPLRAASEAFYEVGSQLAHFIGARLG